jgi:hypothetical protein
MHAEASCLVHQNDVVDEKQQMDLTGGVDFRQFLVENPKKFPKI